MPEWLRYSLVLAMTMWCICYFAKVLWMGLTSGKLLDSRIGATRARNPIAFWFSMVVGILFMPLFAWLAVSIAGHLLGFWEFRF